MWPWLLVGLVGLLPAPAPTPQPAYPVYQQPFAPDTGIGPGTGTVVPPSQPATQCPAGTDSICEASFPGRCFCQPSKGLSPSEQDTGTTSGKYPPGWKPYMGCQIPGNIWDKECLAKYGMTTPGQQRKPGLQDDCPRGTAFQVLMGGQPRCYPLDPCPPGQAAQCPQLNCQATPSGHKILKCSATSFPSIDSSLGTLAPKVHCEGVNRAKREMAAMLASRGFPQPQKLALQDCSKVPDICPAGTRKSSDNKYCLRT
jgi:hypothetical protein